MSWTRHLRDEQVAREFRRALHGSASDHAVAEAERAVRIFWLDELARLQEEMTAEYAVAHLARAAAWTAVHDRRRAGDRPGLAEAQRALGKSNADLGRCAEADRALTRIVEVERDVMALADEESDLVATANRIRVRGAWEDLRAVWMSLSPGTKQ